MSDTKMYNKIQALHLIVLLKIMSKFNFLDFSREKKSACRVITLAHYQPRKWYSLGKKKSDLCSTIVNGPQESWEIQ